MALVNLTATDLSTGAGPIIGLALAMEGGSIMWKPIVISACAIPTAGAVSAQAAEIADPATAPQERELNELEASFNRAVLKGDVAFFSQVFADDITHVSQSGRLRSKAEWLAGRRQGESNYTKYETDDLKLRLYGETAVVSGIADAAWREKAETNSGRFRFTRVWVRSDGRWQIVAFHSTAVE